MSFLPKTPRVNSRSLLALYHYTKNILNQTLKEFISQGKNCKLIHFFNFPIKHYHKEAASITLCIHLLKQDPIAYVKLK